MRACCCCLEILRPPTRWTSQPSAMWPPPSWLHGLCELLCPGDSLVDTLPAHAVVSLTSFCCLSAQYAFCCIAGTTCTWASRWSRRGSSKQQCGAFMVQLCACRALIAAGVGAMQRDPPAQRCPRQLHPPSGIRSRTPHFMPTHRIVPMSARVQRSTASSVRTKIPLRTSPYSLRCS